MTDPTVNNNPPSADPAPPPVPAPTPTPAPGPLNWRRFVPTNWQSIVATLAVIAATSLLNRLGFTPTPLPVPDPPFPIYQGTFGWVEPREDDRLAALESPQVYRWEDTDAAQADPLGDKDGNAFLWKFSAAVRGAPVPTLNQGSVGSCVGHGWATGVNYLVVIQAALKTGPPIDATVTIAPEVIYGGSRVNVNGGRAPLFGDGSNGSWAAKFCTEYGTAARGKYGPYDITVYSESNCRSLGNNGIQNELLTECKKNVVGSAALVTSAADAKKALMQGYPIPVCSNTGFAGQSSRDADGFLRAAGVWPHCMCIIGYRQDKDAFYIMNSWGESWVSGPLGIGDPPAGGFWVKSTTVDAMLKQGDSYAISTLKGFPRRKLQPDDWLVAAPSPSKVVIAPRRADGPFAPRLEFGGPLYAMAP
ncbi:C1 family peptidase [Zavarzinella formosa]|uniref:hypothetical protein n=1 Tax=Zavarzinella formosa TaxID=360055 RepID=UPI0002E79A75|nr:hypothetical protein [Zavarzinella formosa]